MLMTWWQATIAVLAGMVLGLAYFGGLWWTIRRLAHSRSPGMLAGASFVVRTAAVLGGMWLATGGRWPQLLLCLIGFMMVRAVGIRYCKAGQ